MYESKNISQYSIKRVHQSSLDLLTITMGALIAEQFLPDDFCNLCKNKVTGPTKKTILF